MVLGQALFPPGTVCALLHLPECRHLVGQEPCPAPKLGLCTSTHYYELFRFTSLEKLECFFLLQCINPPDRRGSGETSELLMGNQNHVRGRRRRVSEPA